MTQTIGQMIDCCMADACGRSEHETFVSDLSVRSWPQVWPDTSCGFPGAGGQAITGAQTVLIENHMTGEWFVYHGGRLAYRITHPSEHFQKAFSEQQFPGAADPWRHLNHPDGEHVARWMRK